MKSRYHVVWSTNLEEFEKEVISHVADGWSFVGGVSMSGSNFAQAMVKLEYESEVVTASAL